LLLQRQLQQREHVLLLVQELELEQQQLEQKLPPLQVKGLEGPL
jgi:hypothetical protein